jgi:hypothetical protein
MGGAAIRGGQGLARVETLQAQAARESERRGAVDRIRAEPKAATSLRIQRTEETGASGRATPAGSQPIRVVWRSKASQETLSAPSEGFSTSCNVLGSPHSPGPTPTSVGDSDLLCQWWERPQLEGGSCCFRAYSSAVCLIAPKAFTAGRGFIASTHHDRVSWWGDLSPGLDSAKRCACSLLRHNISWSSYEPFYKRCAE